GIFCSVIRVPVTFPPEKFPGVLLSGMCVPDLKGSQGSFCLCTTRKKCDNFRVGGVRVPIERDGELFCSYIPGPQDPLRGGTETELRAVFEIQPNIGKNQARIKLKSHSFTVRLGEYSDWITVKFKGALGFGAHGICRFYLKELSPDVEIYI